MKALLRQLFGLDRDDEPQGSGLEGRGHLGDAPVAPVHGRTLTIDGNTRTFWARGGAAATTLVEAEPHPLAGPDRRHIVGAEERSFSRPRGNPAFSETLFIELMRAGQFSRAYQHISPECQRLWGSEADFSAAVRDTAIRKIQGVSVREVRYVDPWTDPDTGVTHSNVAELEVEYTFGTGQNSTRIERTVHLVPVDGRWRSLCAPPRTPEREP